MPCLENVIGSTAYFLSLPPFQMVIFKTISNAWCLGLVELSFPQPYCPTSGRVAEGSTSHQIVGMLEADLKGVQSPGPRH